MLCSVALACAGCGKKETPAKGSSDTAGANTPAQTSGAQKAGQPAPATGRAIEISGNDQMKFSITEIRAKPGEALSVTLVNVGTMPKMSMGHNWVLLKNASVVEGFVNAAMTAPTTDYIPASKNADILAHTKLLGPKEKDTVTFNAPKEPGRYPFVCSFPGHFQVGMKGELIVE